MEAEIPFFVVCVCFCWDFSWVFFSVLKSETLCVGVLADLNALICYVGKGDIHSPAACRELCGT